MIVFVGSNPSRAAGCTTPFTPNTRSHTIIKSWMDAASVGRDHLFYNVSNQATPNNRPLKISEIKECIPGLQESLRGFTKIVALGKTAHRALQMAGIPHLELSHPSGCNRKNNCPFYVNEQISKLRDYAYPQ
jgi:uracil-DNA glycosylase